ncbi:UDP-N-acetylmuramoyl-L-alanyl-D-glutamate--2,6-diaminopimelate ligase [Candidatus Nitrosacidococcus tergens]|uniref:UDP-N-acetylmuramoyl-L-alanyl-D-glutamate--2,6-diaminopimelate ligase n=1 Tax=Candidatus Nitrosacidococcus tergens TaxID=553981 RepID=A0A7G1QAU9_9GAMM|nr:UDP-N-acetylmuramoyl-L-alanyl-D-glutamate--2,6-diaminopimelate ligase [Candidatus Nitrosacidococcus tergens]CAB1276942.1 UDP-N-acetylmuramoyl-L-alanyl-D-glutamate--2,6-diaminopimelate ligase [Candidatus Nitrosacidococcus tergens]
MEQNYQHSLMSLLREWLEPNSINLDHNPIISHICMNSREVNSGSLFFACLGQKELGHNYIPETINKGVRAIIFDSAIPISLEIQSQLQALNILCIPIPELHKKIGCIADQFYFYPSKQIRITGITGTNGKTSVSHFLVQALHSEQTPCGIIGTLGIGTLESVTPSKLTTPDSLSIHKHLSDFCNVGVSNVVIEVSSHALDQGRVNGINFNNAIFTNLSRDHLDYHHNMANYEAAKSKLFHWPELEYAVINIDDKIGCNLISKVSNSTKVISYGLSDNASLQAKCIHYNKSEISLEIQGKWGSSLLQCPLLGKFNVYNILAALGGLLAHNIPFDEALERLSQIKTVPGRMELLENPAGPLVVVDYAHTPDALSQVLYSLKEHLDPKGKLWCIFGCGGNRDSGKRSLMGEVAEQFSDFVVLTDDNPREEDPVQIIIDIMSGMKHPDKIYKYRPRSEAISRTIQLAKSKDIILIAGKGHEEYQQIGTKFHPFSDKQCAQQALKDHKNNFIRS